MSAPRFESLFGGSTSTPARKVKPVPSGNFHSQNLFADKKVPEAVKVTINSSYRGKKEEKEINITTPIQPRAPLKTTREVNESLFDAEDVGQKPEKVINADAFKYQPPKGTKAQKSNVVTESLFVTVDK